MLKVQKNREFLSSTGYLSIDVKYLKYLCLEIENSNQNVKKGSTNIINFLLFFGY